MDRKFLLVCSFICFFVVGCERYSAFKDAELVASFSKQQIEVGEKFVLTFKVVSSKNGTVNLPKDRLCSIRFLLHFSSGEESERFCPNADSERIEFSQSKSFDFYVQGSLIKEGDKLKLKFADDVYLTIVESDELSLMLEYTPGFFESDSSIHLAKPLLIEVHQERISIK